MQKTNESDKDNVFIVYICSWKKTNKKIPKSIPFCRYCLNKTVVDNNDDDSGLTKMETNKILKNHTYVFRRLVVVVVEI